MFHVEDIACLSFISLGDDVSFSAFITPSKAVKAVNYPLFSSDSKKHKSIFFQNWGVKLGLMLVWQVLSHLSHSVSLTSWFWGKFLSLGSVRAKSEKKFYLPKQFMIVFQLYSLFFPESFL